MTRGERNKIHKIIIDTLAPLGAERISIFGSFARGDLGPDSDIDILIRFPEPSSRKKPIGLAWFSIDQDLEKQIGRKVDLITEQSLSPQLKTLIEKDLVVIYDKAG